jgi:hypothetical protein
MRFLNEIYGYGKALTYERVKLVLFIFREGKNQIIVFMDFNLGFG